MITVAELRSMEGAVVAVARGLTAELRSDAGGACIRFESVTGAQAVVRVSEASAPADVASLCPSSMEDMALTDAA